MPMAGNLVERTEARRTEREMAERFLAHEAAVAASVVKVAAAATPLVAAVVAVAAAVLGRRMGSLGSKRE